MTCEEKIIALQEELDSVYYRLEYCNRQIAPLQHPNADESTPYAEKLIECLNKIKLLRHPLKLIQIPITGGDNADLNTTY